MADDYSATIATTGRLGVGGSARGEFETAYDSDWFKLSLKAGATYILTLSGAASGDGTLPADGSFYFTLMDSKGNNPYGSGTLYSGYAADSMGTLQFTAAVSGDFFVVASAYSALGSYTLRARTPAADDYSDNSSTRATLQSGVASAAVFEQVNDVDWFKFHAEKGQIIVFDAGGVAAANGGAYRTVYDGAGGIRAFVTNDPFKVAESGDYYLAVSASGRLGAYTQTLQVITDDYADNNSTTGQLSAGGQAYGVIDYNGDVDRFKIYLEAGQIYTLSLRPSGAGTFTLALRDPDTGYPVATSSYYGGADTPTFRYQATVSGLYSVDVSGSSTARPGYTLLASAGEPDDFGGTRDTATTLDLNAPVSGRVQASSDVDMFKLDLQAGVTYLFELANATSQLTLSSQLSDSAGAILTSLSYGSKSYSYTPGKTGSYYISASYTYATDTAIAYTLTASAPQDDYAANAAGAGRLAVGGSATGALEAGGGDRDWFAVTLNAGGYYWFKLDGSNEKGGTLSYYPNVYLKLYDSSGKLLATSSASYSATAGILDYKAAARGTYYVEVSAPGNSGSYTVKAQLGTPDDYGSDKAHASVIQAGVSLKGALELPTDMDVFKLGTVAGMSYIVELTPDPENGSLRSYGNLSISDGQSGVALRTGSGSYDKIYGVFDATQGGDYYLSFSSWNVTGAYTLKVSAAGIDDYAATSATSAAIDPNRPAHGTLHVSDDHDWIKVHLDAGRTYVFDLQGKYSGGGTLDTNGAVLTLMNDNNGALATSAIPTNAGAGVDPRIQYVASTTGDFYLDVHNNYGVTAGSIGTYTVREVQANLDTTGPRLLASSVAAGSTTASPATKIVLTFDETVMIGSGITLTDSTGAVVKGNYATEVAVAGNTVTFDPHAYLIPGATYLLNLPQGSVVDLAGNPAAASLSFSFTVTPPVGSGTAGNDYLPGGGGVTLDGGAGIDTVFYQQAWYYYDITRNTDGSLAVRSYESGKTDTLTNVERLLFSNTARAFDVDGTGGQAYRMYQSAFNRTPDNAGLGLWISNMDKGMSLSQVAAYFIASDEFIKRYGAAPSDTGFVTLLYKNVLHRDPEAAGLAHWLDQLHGSLSREDALVAFSESNENHTNVASIIGKGFDYTLYGS
ncbi:DUF4214 domain-containing protein [Duganella callida]|uniref:DUF4214 domain-containing protein n=1 Tax=Duganella callida TaxID=2561932 RepID=A0A4Y9RVH8_9BURK|nr:DUF4214 domain-containing protein [Duganella callida]TFW13307.1 DUF4214 domain-containing protein [Duganella callida]